MKAKTLIGLVLASTVAVLTLPAQQAMAAVEVGVLKCKAVPGTRLNLLIRSTVDIKCTFEHKGGTEMYRGETGIELGLDLSFRKDEEFAFTVVSSSGESAGKHALSGKYVGATAAAAAGVGLGASALIGGSNDNFGLNPLAIETSRGIGIAGGIGFLYIEPDK